MCEQKDITSWSDKSKDGESPNILHLDPQATKIMQHTKLTTKLDTMQAASSSVKSARSEIQLTRMASSHLKLVDTLSSSRSLALGRTEH